MGQDKWAKSDPAEAKSHIRAAKYLKNLAVNQVLAKAKKVKELKFKANCMPFCDGIPKKSQSEGTQHVYTKNVIHGKYAIRKITGKDKVKFNKHNANTRDQGYGGLKIPKDKAAAGNKNSKGKKNLYCKGDKPCQDEMVEIRKRPGGKAMRASLFKKVKHAKREDKVPLDSDTPIKTLARHYGVSAKKPDALHDKT